MPSSDSSGDMAPSPVVIRGGSTVTITIQIRVLPDDGSVEAGAGISETLNQIREKVDQLMPTMDEVRAAVKRNNDAGDAFRTYIKGVVDQLKQVNQNPSGPTQEELQAIIDDLNRGTEADVAALTENTPAAGGDPNVDPNNGTAPNP